MPSTRSILEIGYRSIAGQRPENQDRVAHFDSSFGHVFLVADGMGGHRGGSRAASLATSRLPGILAALPPSIGPQAALVEAIARLNAIIIQESEAGGGEVAGMGSTLAAVLVCDTPDGSLAIGAHLGDSRIYFLRSQRMFRLTRDHTMAQSLIDSGALTPGEAANHPRANALTRVLGRPNTASIDLTSWILLQAGDIFLICSDGLSGYAADEEIRESLLPEAPPDELANRLIGLARQNQSEDNISVMILRVAQLPEQADTAG